jgi:SAM-dependent methyltransferase
MKIIEWLKLPETKYIKDRDDPAVTLLHGEIIQKKLFLKRIYVDFYRQFAKAVPEPADKVLVELGSGGGFIKEVIDNIITSDVLDVPNVDKVFSAIEMPFENASVDAFFMIDVLHHIADTKTFFEEVLRSLKVGGKVVMIEPANTPWSRFIYKNFHHENFDPTAQWGLEKDRPLSVANGALPWIIFSRDREKFCRLFPSLQIVRMHSHTPLLYLLSGGLTFRQLVPPFTYPIFKIVEHILSPLNGLLGMFQTIELEKTWTAKRPEKIPRD